MPQQNNLDAYKHNESYIRTLVHIRSNNYISKFFWTGLFTSLNLLSEFQPKPLNNTGKFQKNTYEILQAVLALLLQVMKIKA